jgi:large subunit ribosomal protein L25
MTQTTETFKIEARKPGKGISGKYRVERKVPAVIYGPKMENMNCVMDEIFVQKHSGSKHESSIFQTTSDDAKLSGLKVMIKKIQRHPGTSRPVHVDLYALDMTAKIKVHVRFEFEGEAKGVKEGGGVLQTTLREVELECNPTDIPQSIKVDVSGVELNGSLHISDITFPAGVTVMTALDRTICTVAIPKEEPAEPAAEAATEGAAPADGTAPADEKKD